MCVPVIDSLYLSFLSWNPLGSQTPTDTPNLPCQAFYHRDEKVTDKAPSTVPSVQPCSVNRGRVQHWEMGPQVSEVGVR